MRCAISVTFEEGSFDNATPTPQNNGGALLADYLDEDQLAKELGVGLRTVQRWRILKIGPPVTWIGQTRDPHYRIESTREWRSREQTMPRERAGRRITKPTAA